VTKQFHFTLPVRTSPDVSSAVVPRPATLVENM